MSKSPPASKTIPRLLRVLSEQRGADPAVIHSGEAVSYSQLEQRSLRLRDALVATRFQPDDRVGLLAMNRLEWIEIYFGTLAAGGTLHPTNTWATVTELDDFLRAARPHTFILQSGQGGRNYLADLRTIFPELWEADPKTWFSPRHPTIRNIVVIDEDSPPSGAWTYEAWLDNAREGQLLDVPDRSTEGSTAIVLYTSGSASVPKAVPLAHRGLVDNGWAIGERMGLESEDRVLVSIPLFWSYGSANALMATLSHGATLVLQDKFEAGATTRLIAETACTAIYLLPPMIHALRAELHSSPGALATLRTGVMIGTPHDVYIAAEELGIGEICNVYGLTEVYGNCCVTPHTMALKERMHCQGPPLPGTTIRIVAHDGTECPPGAIGEIEVKGHVMAGYEGVEQPKDVFTPDGFFRTGDLGYLDTRGCMHFTERATDMIKTSGINVAPVEVEGVLALVPGVEEVCVVGAPDRRRGEVVIAYVSTSHGSVLIEEELIAHCRESLASYKVPRRLVMVDSLPRTGTGKLRRSVVKEWARTHWSDFDTRMSYGESGA